MGSKFAAAYYCYDDRILVSFLIIAAILQLQSTATNPLAKYFKYWSINAQLLTNYSPKSCFFVEKIKLKKAKYSLSNVEDLSTFIIIDDEQLFLLIGRNGKKKVAALWTNYDAFVKSLKTLFLELWNNGS